MIFSWYKKQSGKERFQTSKMCLGVGNFSFVYIKGEQLPRCYSNSGIMNRTLRTVTSHKNTHSNIC